MKKHAIQPTRAEDYAEWYQQVIRAADMAESSVVRGCMVIKPWGFGVWEQIQHSLDGHFKATGHQNAYFPLFIPKSFLEKEAQHVEGFAKQCAVVTHSRLVNDGNGQLKAASPLEEPLIVRPTSETIIGESFSRWIQSYRDLPLLINQWANVVRWEMRPRLFLRTSEFLWQEGHTAHATRQEAWEETLRMLEIYRRFAEEEMALPVIFGKKTPSERFPGADETFCIEAMMQDGKALQAGTSHFLGQHFSHACDIQFTDESGQKNHAWTTSWGVSTRLIGALIMAHSDDDGLILPPRLAPMQVIILPILHGEETRTSILESADQLAAAMRKIHFHGQPVRAEVDRRDLRGGEKSWQWIKKGVPVRIEIGPRDLLQNNLTVARRDREDKISMAREEFLETLPELLQSVQDELFQRALKYRQNATRWIDNLEEFRQFFATENGFAETYFCGDEDLEKRMKTEFNVTIRCIPLSSENDAGPCFGNPRRDGQRVVWARAY